MAYVALAGMAALTNLTAQDCHLQPNDVQMEHLLQHVYADLDQVLTVCRLSNRQKYAVLWQGVTCIEDVMRYLGSRNYDIALSRNYLVLYSGGFGYS